MLNTKYGKQMLNITLFAIAITILAIIMISNAWVKKRIDNINYDARQTIKSRNDTEYNYSSQENEIFDDTERLHGMSKEKESDYLKREDSQKMKKDSKNKITYEPSIRDVILIQ